MDINEEDIMKNSINQSPHPHELLFVIRLNMNPKTLRSNFPVFTLLL